MASQTVPPPPAFQYSAEGSQVSAARAMASFSKGLEGSPGTVYQRQAISPVSTS